MLSRFFALLLILLFIPLLCIIGIIISIHHPGPLFYSQLREGKHGKPFRIWKLRTMVKNSNQVLEELLLSDKALASEWKAYGNLKSDPRIAGKLAKFTRQTSIDEIPQLWNVCKGEMAFIGPRPLEIFLAEQLSQDVRAARNAVLPGMTGLWQIGPRNESNVQQMQHYDLLYIERQSLSLNMYILCQTIIVLLKRKGA